MPWLRSQTKRTRHASLGASSASESCFVSVSSAIWDVIITHGGLSSTPLAFRTLAKLACVSREASTAVRAVFKTTKTLKIEPSTDFQDEKLCALARTLINTDAFANVTEVDVSYDVCTDDGVSALLQAIESGALKHLTHLNLGINPISTDGIRELIRVAEGGALAQLSVLKLDNIDVNDEGVRLLGQAGERGVFGQVTVLGLGRNEEFGVDGVRALAQSIQRGAFAQLTGLDLSGTKVCAIGFRELAEAAEHNLAQLKILGLDSCDIYESHIQPDDGSDPGTDDLNFFNAMQAMKRGAFAQLISLGIGSTILDSYGVQMLVDAIEEGALTKLTELRVSSTGYDNANQIWLAVAGALERGRLPHLNHFFGGVTSDILSECSVMLGRDVARCIDKLFESRPGLYESIEKELRAKFNILNGIGSFMTYVRNMIDRVNSDSSATPDDHRWTVASLRNKIFHVLLPIRSLIYSTLL